MRIVLVLALMFCFFSNGVQRLSADEINSDSSIEEKENWYIGPRLGASAFTGILGAEVQYRNIAFSFGLPARVGFKYYFMEPKHSWFIGTYFSKWDFEDDEIKDGILYTDKTITEVGFGGGYRWRWGTGWDLSLGFAVAYGEEEFENGVYIRTEKFIGIRPELSAGYSF